MGTYSLTRSARADLKSIASYTQRRWGRQQRLLYARQFDDAFQMLAHSPESGITCDTIKKGYRKFPNGSHLIFYRLINADEIEIVRILHKRVDALGQFELT